MGNCWIPCRGLNVVLLDERSADVVRWRPKMVVRNDEVRANLMFLAAVGTEGGIYACLRGKDALCVLAFGLSAYESWAWVAC